MTDPPESAAPAFIRQADTTPGIQAAAPWAIRATGIGKQYRRGIAHGANDNLREDLMNTLKRLFLRARGTHDKETFWALRDIDLEVLRGETLGIIGRNGAGKSTLLKILSRITVPTTGELRYRGRLASLLEVGTGFHRELTGRENIFMNGAILGMRREEIRGRFDAIVDFAGVEKFLDTPVKFYSSGMYVRLAFAVAAHLRTDLLIVDEVLAVGDAAFQKKCLGKMSEVAHEGRTVLFVSHNLAAVRALCNRAVLLSDGRIVAAGGAEEVIEQYVSRAAESGEETEPGRYDLLKRDNTYGDSIIVRGLEIRDSDGAPCNTIEMGKRLQIAVDLEGFSALGSPLLGVIFKTAHDQWATSVTTGMVHPSISGPRQHHERAIVDIPSLSLTSGTYYIDVTVYQPGLGRVDYVDRAATLHVLESDVYGYGQRITGHFGIFYLYGIAWRIEPASDSC